MAKYLSEIIKETGPIDFEFVARSELKKKKKRDGGTYDQYDYTFVTRADSKAHTEGIFPKTHDVVLSKALKGDICHAELTPDGKFVSWSIIKGNGDQTPPATQSNYKQVQGERKFTEIKEDEESKWHEIAASKIVHNFMMEAYKKDKKYSDAGAEAYNWYFAQQKTVEAILEKEKNDLLLRDI